MIIVLNSLALSVRRKFKFFMTRKVLLLIIFISLLSKGCNLFEGLDNSVRSDNTTHLSIRADIALDKGNYTKAFELYQRVLEKERFNDNALRGAAHSKAGMAGFNMIDVFDIVHNEQIPTDSSAVLFKAANTIKEAKQLRVAIEYLNRISFSKRKDTRLQSVLVVLYACKSLLQMYDSNKNSTLDQLDRITFTVGDDNTSNWENMFQKLTCSDSLYSLEKAFISLAESMNLYGEEWSFVSPINEIRISGTYLKQDRNFIMAVGNFVELLMVADGFYNLSEDDFKKTIMSLDAY